MINGKWHSQGSAAQQSAVLMIEEDEHFQLKTQTEVIQFGSLDKIEVSDRLGNVERKLTFADGSVFTTKDNESIDRYFKKYVKTNSFIHAIESNLGWALIALVMTVVAGFAFFKWGVPATSHAVAHALPQKTGDIIGANTLEFLDRLLFEPSQLEEAQRQQIRSHFQSTLADPSATTEINYTLHFRAWGEGDHAIPNALALPSGDIILTDKFVELSQNQNEIDSVLLHEMGHVEHRHTLQMITQATLVTTAIALFTGDASGAADMGIGLGSLLISTSYSRGHESEADQYAFEHMLQAGIDPTSFADIMERITTFAYTSETEDITPPKDNDSESQSDKSTTTQANDSTLLDYLSTHPNTAERIRQAKHYAQCHAKGLRVCYVLGPG